MLNAWLSTISAYSYINQITPLSCLSPIVKIKNQLNKLHNHDQDIQSELIQTAKSKSSINTDVVSVLQIATCIEKDGGHSDKLIEDYHLTL